jgi:O-antigen/teichoic acid export membrane protein
MNTLYRGAAEIIGRLASLALFAEAGRLVGASGLGSFVFAYAFVGFVMLPVDLGLDRYLLRVGASDREAGNHLFLNVLTLKLTSALVVFSFAALGLHLARYSQQGQEMVWVLAPGILADSVARTQLARFLAYERGGPPSLIDAIQRICSAVLGIAALRAGYGVLSVGITYSAGSLIGVIIGFVQLSRTVGMPQAKIRYHTWRILAASGLPFATQDFFISLLARVDTLILALIASQAVVGRYGAAYRLFESTLFATYAITGAFAAMYTYLGPDTDPPLRAVYQRSVKLSLIALTPLAVAFTVLGAPICRLIYGPSFSSASVPLGILGPAVVLISLITLTNSLMLSRESPRLMVKLTAAMAVVNIVLNLILIPPYGGGGAATAMLATEFVYAILILRMASRTIGGIQWLVTIAGTVSAGGGMVAVTLLLHGHLWPALLAGGAAYLGLLFCVERIVSPLDVRFVTQMVRRRLGIIH